MKAKTPIKTKVKNVAVVAVGSLLTWAVLAWQVYESGVLTILWPGSGIEINDANFRAGPNFVRSHAIKTRGGLSGIASVRTVDGPQVYVFGEDRLFKLSPDLTVRTPLPLPMIAASVGEVEVLELAPGSGVMVGVNRATLSGGSEAVIAFDWNGRMQFQRIASDGSAVDAVAPMRVGDDWGVAVGYNGSYGLCFLDSTGTEKWCNQDVGNVWVVATLDCDGDNNEEILSLPPRTFGRRGNGGLGCYTTNGDYKTEVAFAGSPPYLMHTVDLDGDAHKEITFFTHSLNRTGRFGAIRSDGQTLAEVRAQEGTGRWLRPAPPVGVARTPGGSKDVVMLGPEGELLGVSLSGERWRAGKAFAGVTAMDLDGDGRDEIITLGEREWDDSVAKHTIAIWSWAQSTEPSDQSGKRVTEFGEGDPRRPREPVMLTMGPVRAFAVRPPDGRPSRQELDFRLGCYLGLSAGFRHLSALVQRDVLSRDIQRCEEALKKFDASYIFENDKLAWHGCMAGVETVFREYRAGASAEEELATIRECWREVRGTPAQRPPTSLAPPEDLSRMVPPPLPSSVADRFQVAPFTPAQIAAAVPKEQQKPGSQFWGSFAVCVTSEGHVVNAKVEFGTRNDEVDEGFLGLIRQTRFRPFLIAGTPIPFCSTLHIRTRFPAAAPPAAKAPPAVTGVAPQ